MSGWFTFNRVLVTCEWFDVSDALSWLLPAVEADNRMMYWCYIQFIFEFLHKDVCVCMMY